MIIGDKDGQKDEMFLIDIVKGFNDITYIYMLHYLPIKDSHELRKVNLDAFLEHYMPDVTGETTVYCQTAHKLSNWVSVRKYTPESLLEEIKEFERYYDVDILSGDTK